MSEDLEQDTENTQDEQSLDDNQLVCALSGETKKVSLKESNLQSIIRMLNEEYKFELDDMERDFTITFPDPETGKQKKLKIDLVVFEKDAEHKQNNIIRICFVQDDKTKENDKKKGAEATLKYVMDTLPNCQFGLWSNGLSYLYFQEEMDEFENTDFVDISDFPAD